MPLSTTKQHTTIIKVAFSFAGTNYMIKYQELSLIMMNAAHAGKIILIFV